MTCQACEIAERDPLTDKREEGCDSCLARVTAQTGGHLLEPASYGRLLFKFYGARHREGEAMVRKWAAKIKQARMQK